MTHEVPSPIDLRQMADAREWASKAEQRPGRSEILDRIAEEAAARAPRQSRILELGSGPGVLAERILQRIHDARYTALDFSPAMHELARARLAPFTDRITFLERSFKAETWTDGLEPFDLVVTNQAVHELRHKRYAAALHRQVHGLLKPDGSYLVSDHVSGDGGLPNAELYMTADEQKRALSGAGFASVTRLMGQGSLVLHAALKV
ncbi:MAG: class I SAM-dependent methyltransferase [Alphaproteobacteria bacterium]|nr:class I SAM-dependent methyltransferase [Alphaproteobacteria bacterium]